MLALETLAFSPPSQVAGNTSSAVFACHQRSATTATALSPTFTTCLTPGMPCARTRDFRTFVSVPTTCLLASEPESAVFRHDAKLLDPGTRRRAAAPCGRRPFGKQDCGSASHHTRCHPRALQ